jgi:DNA polymerase alpha subunit B
VVGRLISTPTDTGRPTASSLQIESSRATGAGKRTPIMFAPDIKVRGAAQGVKGFGVYQGACVALKGRNGGGGDFVVGEVLMVSLIYACGGNEEMFD